MVRVISALPEGTWGWDGAGCLQEEKEGLDHELVMTVTCDQSHDCKKQQLTASLAGSGEHAEGMWSPPCFGWQKCSRVANLSEITSILPVPVPGPPGRGAWWFCSLRPPPPPGVLPTVPCKSTSDPLDPLLPASYYSSWMCDGEPRSHWLGAVLVTVACSATFRVSMLAPVLAYQLLVTWTPLHCFWCS